jgi:hypothetical protein
VSTIHRQSDAALARITAPAVLIYERRESEVVRYGWVFEAFPRRFRSPRSPIVTLPRVTTDMPARAARVYPGRQCWYFHRRSATNLAELLRCEDAGAWLGRALVDVDHDVTKPFVERSTAYLKTDYNPASALAEQRDLDAAGLPKRLCCQIRGLAELGIKAEAAGAGTAGRCIETGEP